MKNLHTTLFAVAALLLLTACSKLTEDNLQKVHNGMTTDEVKAILGEPTDSSTEPIPIVGGNKTTLTYSGPQAHIVIVLKNDQVQSKEGNFGTGQ